MAYHKEGFIHSVPHETIDDLSAVLAFVETTDAPKRIQQAAQNLLAYIEDYKLNEQE